MSRLKQRILYASFALSLMAAPALAAPNAVASIKPVHAILSAVMGGIAEPQLLLDAGVSEHTAQLRPSQMETLAQADLIVVVGENLEAFLEKALSNPDIAAKTFVEAGKLQGLKLFPVREGGLWEKHDHAHEERAEDETGHDHGSHDPHVWMDPENAKVMASAMAKALSEKDPANAAKYQANVERFSTDLDKLSTELAAAVAPLQDKRYIVFHDAYQYFENRFGLNPAGTIILNPEATPGAKRLAEIQKRINETGATCVFAEPQFEPRYVQTVIEGTNAKPGVLDGLGADIPAGPKAYQALLRKFVSDLSSCLTKR